MKTPLIDGNTARLLVERHGSPLYVYRKSIVEKRYRHMVGAIPYPDTKIFYACKANANIELLRLLERLGSSVECVSKEEVKAALAAGFDTSRIAYTCSNIPKEEIAWLIERGIEVHLDSLNQMRWWGELKPNSTISVRLNLGYGDGGHKYLITGGDDSKFGIYHADIPELQQIAKQFGLRIVGILQHIGTHIADPASLLKGVELVFEASKQFRDLAFLDFGGGFDIPYRPEEKEIDIKAIGKQIGTRFQSFCEDYGRPLQLRLEPGRYLVAESGALLATVVDIKRTGVHRFVGVNSGFNHLVRVAMYDAYHHIFNISNPSGEVQRVNVVGNICESADVFAEDRELPQARLGDLLLIADAGAYGYAMASDYNLRAKPKEIVID